MLDNLRTNRKEKMQTKVSQEVVTAYRNEGTIEHERGACRSGKEKRDLEKVRPNNGEAVKRNDTTILVEDIGSAVICPF